MCVQLTKWTNKIKKAKNKQTNRQKQTTHHHYHHQQNQNQAHHKTPSQTGKLCLGMNIYKRVWEEAGQDSEEGGARPGYSCCYGMNYVPQDSYAATLISLTYLRMWPFGNWVASHEIMNPCLMNMRIMFPQPKVIGNPEGKITKQGLF